jgi:hypothetical protein
MKKRQINSDLIRSARWSSAVLDLFYQDGKHFRYTGVPESVYLKLMSEDSPGSFWLGIRDKYDFLEVKK